MSAAEPSPHTGVPLASQDVSITPLVQISTRCSWRYVLGEIRFAIEWVYWVAVGFSLSAEDPLSRIKWFRSSVSEAAFQGLGSRTSVSS